MYAVETYAVQIQIHDENPTGAATCARRQQQTRPVVERYFKWIDKQFESHGFPWAALT